MLDQIMICEMEWVKWNSEYYKMSQGVRQGGILSPSFFAVFVDGVLQKLSTSKRGCIIKGVCMNSIMYSDDLVLLSISVNDLKLLIDICVKEFNDIGMEINIKKSGCLRVGVESTLC